MGPPPKGTAKYKKYLREQAKRRKASRVQKRAEKFEASVKAHVVKLKAEHIEEVAKLVRRSNVHFRARGKAEKEATMAKHEVSKLRAEAAMQAAMAKREVSKLRAELRDAKERAAMFEEWWKTEETNHKSTRAERNKAQRTVMRWDVWWRDLSEKAPKKVKQAIAYYARPRPPPADRCWGGRTVEDSCFRVRKKG